jgi:hypothetical protein
MDKQPAGNQKKNKGHKSSFRKEFVYLCSCCAAIVLLVLTGVNFNGYLTSNKVLGASSDQQAYYETLIEETTFWQNFLITNPDYFNGWVRLIDLNLAINNQAAAKTAYREASRIDPNSIKLQKYRSIFGE